MRLTPYRFSLPVIGLLLASVLIALENSLRTRNLLNLLNDVINLPASVAFGMIPYCCFQGHNVFGYRTWLTQFLFLSLVGLWWYFVGLELDLQLLRLLATKTLLFRLCWLLIAVLLQVLGIGFVATAAAEIGRHPSDRMIDDVVSGVLLLLGVAWLEVIAWRFFRAWRAKGA